MASLNSILEAIDDKTKTLVWNDPDPIEGNDYTISNIIKINEEMATIHYNDYSEAEVPLWEIEII